MSSPKYCALCPSAPLRGQTAQPILREAPILKISDDLARSLKRPTARTLRLIDRALAWLRPFESPRATTSSIQEKRELLSLLTAHRLLLSPYIDVDSIESHLRR